MVTTVNIPSHQEAWEMILGQLRAEMSRADFDTWVRPLRPLGFRNEEDEIFRLAAINDFGRKWVQSRLDGRISKMLSGLYQRDVQLSVEVSNGFYSNQNVQMLQSESSSGHKKTSKSAHKTSQPVVDADAEQELEKTFKRKGSRKAMLQRAYGSQRAMVIQPERGMFQTNYMWNQWVPLIGLSAYAVIKAARMMCYWNPETGELRNIIETEMKDLADRAHVSVRTLKTMLKNELIRRYFIRYTVRRVMTPNGVRTAGIRLQVRMDDPLTPQDQETIGDFDDGTWFSAEFEDEHEEWGD
jgi:hypothetical protein